MIRLQHLLQQHWAQFSTALVLAVLLFVAHPGVVHAATQELTITPTSVNQIIKPGEQYKGSFDVLNRGESNYNFRVYATSYRVKGEEYTPDFSALSTKPNVPSWFTFSQTSAYIKAGQSITINYTVSMPADTPPGGYYATVFSETQYPKSQSGITLNQRVGEIFYLQAAGKVETKGQIASWQADFLQKPPLTAVLRIQNDGAVHFPATVQINVRDIFGHPKYTLSATKEILPQTVRRIEINWKGAPPIGLFKVDGSVSYLNKHETLGTHWVLVMSPIVRIIVAALIGLIIVFGTAKSSLNVRKKVRKKKAE